MQTIESVVGNVILFATRSDAISCGAVHLLERLAATIVCCCNTFSPLL